jgi:glycosyltransferase involved in cell wall biosynthesis
MRICIVTHNIIKGDGQGRANYEIVLEAIRRGYQVTLVAINVAPELQNNSQINWVPISVNGWPTALLSNLIFSLKSRNWLRKNHDSFDVLQIYGCVTDYPADINTVQFVHSGWLRSPFHTSRLRGGLYGRYQWLFSVLNASWEKKAFQKSKLVIAVSERIKQELIAIGVPSANIRVILNGVDVDEFFPGKRDREELSLPDAVPLAMFTGDIRTPRKNLDSVLKALVQVPDLHLAVLGATARSPYPDLAKQLGIVDRVHFLDFRRDVPEIMKAVDFFVFPSRYEACTLVLLEALGTGIPVITSVTTGGAEIVSSECGILLSSSEDVAGLANGMATLASDCELRLQMGRSARAIAKQHTWKSKAEAYNDLFEEYLKTPVHQRCP